MLSRKFSREFSRTFSQVVSPIFPPKWRHRHAAVRRQAIESLPPEAQDIFVQVAREDADAALRHLALRSLRDLQIVHELLASATDEADRTAAESHLTQLLAGAITGGPALQERGRFLDVLDGANWCERLLKEAREVELRRQALARVERQSLLGDVALNDADAGLRLSAAERLSQRSTLERVARGARRRDKRVYALVKERLAALEAAERRPRVLREQAQKLCTQLEALHKSAQRNDAWERHAGAVQVLHRQWDELDLGAMADAAPLRQHFQEISAAFGQGLTDWQRQQARLAAERALQAERIAQAEAVCGQLEGRFAELKAVGRIAQPAEVQEMLAACARRWEALADLPEEAREALAARYATARGAVLETLADEALLVELAPRIEALQASLQSQLALPAVDAPALRELESVWRQLPRPAQLEIDAAAAEALDHGLQRLRERYRQGQERQQAASRELGAMVAQLEEHLRRQTYKPAFALAQKAQQLEESLADEVRHSPAMRGVQKRLHQVQAQLREMHDWRAFANAPVMERLCEDMERLADLAEAGGDDTDYADCAARVSAARAEWKQMTVAQGAVPKALWRRFDAACNRAYAPCQVRFDAEAREREAHLAAKQGVCEGLEEYAERVAVQAVDELDWPALERIIKTADNEWRAIGPVPRRKQAAVNKRFRTVMDRLRGLVREQRARNHEAKEAFIRQAEALLQKVEEQRVGLAEALESAKVLQGKWRHLGPSRGERELWRQFHTACDALFKCRDAERSAHHQILLEQVREREAICAQIEAAARQTGEAFRQARHGVDEAHARWQAAPSLPKREFTRLEQRYRAASERFEKRSLAEQEKHHAEEGRRLYDMAAVCERLEHLTDNLAGNGMGPDEAAKLRAGLQAQFDGFAPLGGVTGKGLLKRYRHALEWLERLLSNDPAACKKVLADERQTNLQTRQRLCLELEILAGIESPPEYREARMRYQVEHLAEQMKRGQRPSRQEALDALERAWHTTGAAPEAQSQDLTKRFQEGMQAAGRAVSE